MRRKTHSQLSRYLGIAALVVILPLSLASCTRPSDDPSLRRVVTLPEEGSPFVAFNIWFKVGSVHDPKGKEGLSVLTAAMLEDASTTEDTYEQILAKVYPMAAGYSSSVDKEMTNFRGVVHLDNLEDYTTLFKNSILSPAFKEQDFTRIKTQVLNYLEQQRRFSSDEELGKELLSSRIFQGTPYQHPEEGYVESVKAITLDDVKAFHGEHYRRDNCVVGLGGGLPQGFAARVRADFDTLPEGHSAGIETPQPSPVEGIHVLIVEKNTAATAISLGFPFELLRSDPDFPAMMLANSWLGEHRSSSSHLYQVIREARGMNYGDYSYIEAYPQGHTITRPPQNVARSKQIFQIWIRPVSMLKEGDMHDRALFATRAALRELTRLVGDGMSQEAFDITRGFLKNYTVNYGSTLSRRLGYRVDDHFYGIADPGHLASLKSELDSLTRGSVNQALAKYLQVENMWIVFITSDAEGLKQKLISGEETPIEYPGEKSREVHDEDLIIRAFPLPVKAENISIINISEVFERQ